MKKNILFTSATLVLLFLFSSCKKDVPIYPTAGFTANVDSYDNYTVNVTSNAINAYRIDWEWGDGLYDYDSYSYASHTYSKTGTYTITQKVTSIDGYTDYAYQTITISSNGGGNNGGGNNGGTTTYTQVKITSLTLREFPAAPSSGAWDFAGKPDIYFKIMDGNMSSTYYTSSTKEDVSNDDCPLYYTNINYTLYNLTATYSIAFYDEDNIDTDELMVACSWTPSSQNNNHASSYNWYNSSKNIDFTLWLTWYTSKGEASYTKPARFKNGQWLTNDPEVMTALNLK